MKKPNHTDSSELAFSLFLATRGVAKPLGEIRTYLGMSSASEDDVSFSSKLQRPFNWHFYNNRKSIGYSDWIPGHRTSEKRFASLLEKLEKYIGKCAKNVDRHNVEDLVEATGRIMHHESSAQATLKFLSEESVTLYCNGVKQSFPLTAFWQDNAGGNKECESFWLRKFSEGFGSFGTLGNNFGKMNFTIEKAFYEGSSDEYLRIYKKLLKKTLIDSMVVLEFVARKSEVFTSPAFATQALSWN